MTPAPMNVLKRDQVRSGGPRRVAPGPAGPGAGGPRRAAAAQARIVDRGDGVALVEVRCPCGEVLHLECRWSSPGAETAARDEQTIEPATHEEVE